MRFGWSPKVTHDRILRMAGVLAVLLIALYIYIYWAQPFSEFLNNLLSNLFSQIVSLFSAITASLVWARYEKSDSPRRVWGPFAIGLWLWVAGDISWGYINMTQGEVPIGMPDVFWMVSYFFFGRALISQYVILVQPTLRELISRLVAMILLLLALLFAIFKVLVSEANPLDNLNALANSFYPAVDVLLGAIALWLARNFAGGAFARPWYGLLIFSFSDLMYAWLENSGAYAWSLEQGNLLTTVADVAYFAAYLVLGLGVLSQWAFLKYGLRSSAETR